MSKACISDLFISFICSSMQCQCSFFLKCGRCGFFCIYQLICSLSISQVFQTDINNKCFLSSEWTGHLDVQLLFQALQDQHQYCDLVRILPGHNIDADLEELIWQGLELGLKLELCSLSNGLWRFCLHQNPKISSKNCVPVCGVQILFRTPKLLTAVSPYQSWSTRLVDTTKNYARKLF